MSPFLLLCYGRPTKLRYRDTQKEMGTKDERVREKEKERMREREERERELYFSGNFIGN